MINIIFNQYLITEIIYTYIIRTLKSMLIFGLNSKQNLEVYCFRLDIKLILI